MPEKTEYVPPSSILSCVREQVTNALLQKASCELGHPLNGRVHVWCNHSVVAELPDVSADEDNQSVLQRGEIRMRFRRTGAENRFLFFIEALFPRDQRAPNFSGFSARGSAKIDSDGRCSAKFDAWVMKWSDDSWSLWL